MRARTPLRHEFLRFDCLLVPTIPHIKLTSFNILRGIDIISPSQQKGELAYAITLSFPTDCILIISHLTVFVNVIFIFFICLCSLLQNWKIRQYHSGAHTNCNRRSYANNYIITQNI